MAIPQIFNTSDAEGMGLKLSAVIQKLVAERLDEMMQDEWKTTCGELARVSGASPSTLKRIITKKKRFHADIIIKVLIAMKCTPSAFFHPVFRTVEWLKREGLLENIDVDELRLGDEVRYYIKNERTKNT